MKPDVEKLLAEIRPHEPSPDLRSKVLDAVDTELAAEKPSPVLNWFWSAVTCHRFGFSSCVQNQETEQEKQTRNQIQSGNKLPHSKYARWERRFTWTSCTALLFAIGLNFLAYHVGEARLAQFRPVVSEPRYIAEMTDTIRSVTNPETAEYFRERLVARWQEKRSRPRNKDAYKHYQQIFQQLAIFEKELCYVQTQPQKRKTGPETGRDLPSRPGGDTSYYQQPRGLGHQFTG